MCWVFKHNGLKERLQVINYKVKVSNDDTPCISHRGTCTGVVI